MSEPILLGGVTVDCKDPKVLSDFYIRMLQWEKTYEDDGFIIIASAVSNVRIGIRSKVLNSFFFFKHIFNFSVIFKL